MVNVGPLTPSPDAGPLDLLTDDDRTWVAEQLALAGADLEQRVDRAGMLPPVVDTSWLTMEKIRG